MAYVARRLLLMVPVAFLVSLVVFYIIHLVPGDPAQIMLGEEHNPQALAALRHQLGLDRPLPVQYLFWIGGVLHGDMGRSVRTGEPVGRMIGERLPASLELGGVALLWSLLVSIPLGALAAIRRGGPLDLLASALTTAGVSVPHFVTGLLLILVIGVGLRLLPSGGFTPFDLSPGDNIARLILPAFTLGTTSAAINLRFTRSSMLEVLGQDYIRTARAKGASWVRMVAVHALKNGLIPVVTVIGIQVGDILQGALVTETIFSWPGVGKLAVDSIYGRDYTIIQGIVLLAAFSYLGVNLLVDLAYAWLDPRIRFA